MNSTGTARMFESAKRCGRMSSGAGGKSEGHIIIKPVESERKTLPTTFHLILISLEFF